MDHPISRYANFAEDILILDMDLASGDIYEKQLSEFLVPEAMGKVQHLAIMDDDWRDLDPEDGMLRPEHGEDPRLTLFGLTGLKTLSLISTSSDLESLDDSADELIDRDIGSLVRGKSENVMDDYVMTDAGGFLDDLKDLSPGWERPNLQLARIIYR